MIPRCSSRCALASALVLALLLLPQPSRAKESLLVGAIADSTKQQPLKAKDAREWLEAALVTSIRQAAGEKYSITTMADIASQLQFQHMRESMGCDDEGCLAEIAGMTGAKYLVFAKLMQAGKTFAFQLTLIHQAKAEVIKASTPNRFQWSTEDCEVAIHNAVGEVFLGKKPGEYRPSGGGSAAAGMPPAESQEAFTRLNERMTGQEYKALIADARAVLKRNLPKYGTIDMNEYSSYCIVQAHYMLKQYEQTVAEAERHLAAFDKGMYRAAVKSAMKDAQRLLRQQERGKGKVDEELARIERERAAAGPSPDPILSAGFDFQRCTTMVQHQQHARAVEECGKAVEKLRGKADAAIRQFYLSASWSQIQALVELGRVKEARAKARALIKAEPEFADQMQIETMMDYWPAE